MCHVETVCEGDFKNLEKQSYSSSVEIKLRGNTSQLRSLFLLFVIVNWTDHFKWSVRNCLKNIYLKYSFLIT